MKSAKIKITAIIAIVAIIVIGSSVFLFNREFKDKTTTLPVNENPQTVVALSSSLAEIWLLAGGQVAGTTSDTLERNFEGISEDVQVVGSVKDPSLEKILELKPDYVILNDSIPGHVALEEPLKSANIVCYASHIETFDDYLKSLHLFCSYTGQEQNYETNGLAVEKQIKSAVDSYTLPSPAPTYLVMRVHSSGYNIMTQDSVVCNILDTLGLSNIAQNGDSELDNLSLEKILETDPDYIFITTMGKEQEALENLDQMFLLQPAWQELSAVKQEHVFILPKELFHYKPNAKWGEAYEEIIQHLSA